MNPINQAVTLAADLFERRGTDLLRYLRRRLPVYEDACDIAQEAYLRFIRLCDPDRLENPEAYLFRIASNLLAEHNLRERGKSVRVPLEETQNAEHTPFDFAATSEIATRLRVVLDMLPALPRAILILHVRDGYTCARIAAEAGISQSMVKKHINSALAVCRKRLRDLNT
jgi:RNA polymerase sigma factor (sigma-70 family)